MLDKGDLRRCDMPYLFFQPGSGVPPCSSHAVTQARTPMYSTGGDDRSGMGFTIMESFMTELKVTSSVGRGTTVHMKRRIIRRGEKT